MKQPKEYTEISAYRAWYLNGKLHRTDGHAIKRADGSTEWYLNGIRYDKKEWEDLVVESQ